MFFLEVCMFKLIYMSQYAQIELLLIRSTAIDIVDTQTKSFYSQKPNMGHRAQLVSCCRPHRSHTKD